MVAGLRRSPKSWLTWSTSLTARRSLYGIDLDAVIEEVHRANMSKLGDDGQPLVRDGKVIKGAHFQRPDVAAVLRAQGWVNQP